MVQVDVFGTYHIDRPGKMKKELRDISTDAEVFFAELPREETKTSHEIQLLFRNPTLRITGWILNGFWGVFGFLLTGQFDSVDAFVTREVAHERSMEVEPVDLNLVRRASNIALPLTVASWIWFLLIVCVFVFGVFLWSDFYIISAVAMGFLPLLPFAYSTLSERDSEMAKNIEDILTSRDDVSRGCLVVGHKHMDGVIEELEKNNVEIGEKHKPKFFREQS